MLYLDPSEVQLSDSWQEGDPTARWRSASGHGPDSGAVSSGSSLLEIDPGCRLPRHTDSAEEIIVVLAGSAEVEVGEERCLAAAGGLVLVPKLLPHQVRNTGRGVLRFAAIYGEPDVVTSYEREVEPDGSAERHPVG
jgi:quercetin dioxygenase-like cupin family protein